MTNNNVFQRLEKKYLLDKKQYDAFMQGTSKYITSDEYGQHTICNIYYDTKNYDLVSRSIEKPDYKEKLRLRCYGVPDVETKAYIEIKKKYKGVVYKRRVEMPYIQAYNFLTKNLNLCMDDQIYHEIEYFKKFYHTEPKIMLAYDRVAYFANEDSDFRITIDKNIRSRDYNLDLRKGDYGELLLDKHMYLMEIKVAGAFPLWLVDIMSELKIYPTSFSKYGNVYKQKIIEKEGYKLCGQVS